MAVYFTIMSEKFKIPRQHSRFNIYQRLFVELLNTHAKEWNVPNKKVNTLLHIQEEWAKDLTAIPDSTTHNHDAVHKRNETLAKFYAEIELVLEYHLLNNENITRADKVLLCISGF